MVRIMESTLKMLNNIASVLFLIVGSAFLQVAVGQGENKNNPKEEDYYRITTVPIPEGVHIEGGGVVCLPDGSLGVCTRRGDVWIIQNPTMTGEGRTTFKKFAKGLHEPLGLIHHDGALYTAQRGELTKLIDTDGDRVADEYKTIYAWPLSANYHEYSFGPLLAPDGNFFVTLNVTFEQAWWRPLSRVPWRGWTLKISEDGSMEPWATGMRSPAGMGLIDGELFYTDNQGDWVGSGGLWHLPKGVFTGHPAGLRWSEQEGSPINLTETQFYNKFDKREVVIDGRDVKPENIQNEENPPFQFHSKELSPQVQLPAVILPHGILGISNSQVKVDETGGKFGPFQNQIFIGDQGQSKIMRVVLEKVKGEYQGVVFDFRAGFQSGVMRMDYDHYGNLFVGETNRGWGSAGTTNSGLQYLAWTGKLPFEMKTVKAMPDGFEVEFTKPVDRKSAEDLGSYSGKSYIYKYHIAYGSPQVNIEEIRPKGVKVSEDGMKVRIVLEPKQHYIHELKLGGIKENGSLEGILHPIFYYTLNNVPEGKKLAPSEYSTKRSSAMKKPVEKKRVTVKNTAVLSDSEIQPILAKNTCVACHGKDKRLVGPSFEAIAKRKYSNEKIVNLIYNPQPKNWPEYATPMAPMPHVPKAEALKMAAWINSLSQ